MVLGILTAVGLTFVAGCAAGLFLRRDDQGERRNRRELEEELDKLKKKRFDYGCCHFFTTFAFFALLFALGILLYVTDFFRNKRGLTTLLLDWRYWFSQDYKIFDYNYNGIAGVVIFLVVVLLPLLYFLCKICFGVMRIEQELKDIREQLHQIGSGDRGAVAQGGWINIAIGNCFNIFCTCYITTVVTSTAMAVMSIAVFVCYVLYTYYRSR